MKSLRFFISSLLGGSFLISFSQVEIDKRIQLTGAGSEAKIEGVEEVVNNHDAANKIYVDTSLINLGISLSVFACGDAVIHEKDGQGYPTVLIGTQCWMKKNLALGGIIPLPLAQDAGDNNRVEMHCNADLPINCAAYGGLYSWSEAMNYQPSQNGVPGTTQGICPVGWHIPTDLEWQVLEAYLGIGSGDLNTYGYRGTNQGDRLKYGGDTGFEARYHGNRHSGGGVYYEFNQTGWFWTASLDSGFAIARQITASQPGIRRFNDNPASGFSVRCLKD